MTATPDDLLARMRDEAAGWHRAPVLSGERESAGGRLVAAVLKLDELLSSGAGYSIVRTDELERLQEIEAEASGRFRIKEIIKPDGPKGEATS